MTIKAVILAGGSGTRLWPLSRMQLPKQFLRLQGESTLLDETIHRLAPLIEQKDVIVVTGREHAMGEAYNSLKPYQTILEPMGRNTAPAIAVAAACLQQQSAFDEDPIMIVLPADHIIKEKNVFQQVLQSAIESAKQGYLVTFGIKPTRADTGFGYIKAELTDSSGRLLENEQEAYNVVEFAEKPDQKTATSYLQSGDYYWNSGMFVWSASSILKEIAIHLPELHKVIEEIRPELAIEGCTLPADLWEKVPNISIDYGVLEQSSNVIKLVPCDIGWSDVGSWDAVYDISTQDVDNNVLQGRVITVGCNNSLILSKHRLIAAVGVKDLCIIETSDAVLVTNRGETQRVREIVDQLKQDKEAHEHLFHCTVKRPWGSYTVLEEHAGFKMKRITVNSGSSLSLQRHLYRSEHWVVVSGVATVTRGEQIEVIGKNQSTYIPIGMKHRLENKGSEVLEIVEIQVGEHLEENDIERLDDIYERNL